MWQSNVQPGHLAQKTFIYHRIIPANFHLYEICSFFSPLNYPNGMNEKLIVRDERTVNISKHVSVVYIGINTSISVAE